MSRETPAQKAAHLLDIDLRKYRSTSINTKELDHHPSFAGCNLLRRSAVRISKRNKVMIIHAHQQDQSDDDHDQGKSVDANMVVLKMRIKKMKADDEGVGPPPVEWKEWEKKVFAQYKEGVSESMEMMQSYLMKTRPSVALGIMALLTMAVPLSSSAVAMNAVKLLRALLAGCHVCIDIDF